MLVNTLTNVEPYCIVLPLLCCN